MRAQDDSEVFRISIADTYLSQRKHPATPHNTFTTTAHS
jgi:hypothetical protein